MNFNEIIRPKSIEEAYSSFVENDNSVIYGGGLFLRQSKKDYNIAIDLSTLDLDFIKETTEDNTAYIEIGAMTTFHSLEENLMLNKTFDGLFKKALKNIIGIQFRNIASVGGTVFGRYGFSELNTILLVLNTKIKLYKGGTIDFKDYLIQKNRQKDIVLSVLVPKVDTKTSYIMQRNSNGDFPYLSVAATIKNNFVTLVVGARPTVATICEESMKIINDDPTKLSEASQKAKEELTFGSDVRASKTYRESICPILVRRALEEVLS